jgi:hypothetical protein
MTLLKRLRNLITGAEHSANKKTSFIFPYSDDPLKKKEEVWQNLQNGLLLEDKGIFVPWALPFYGIEAVAEKRLERADRTEWYLGRRTILDGYEAGLELMRWKFIADDKPIKRLSENLGRDEQGFERFNYLRQYLTGLLGEPANVQLQKFGEADIGEIAWERGDITLTLVGIEHFDLRYTFNIGIKFTNAAY